jgi:hypothetical protein
VQTRRQTKKQNCRWAHIARPLSTALIVEYKRIFLESHHNKSTRDENFNKTETSSSVRWLHRRVHSSLRARADGTAARRLFDLGGNILLLARARVAATRGRRGGRTRTGIAAARRRGRRGKRYHGLGGTRTGVAAARRGRRSRARANIAAARLLLDFGSDIFLLARAGVTTTRGLARTRVAAARLQARHLLLHAVNARGGSDGHDGTEQHSDGELHLHLLG